MSTVSSSRGEHSQPMLALVCLNTDTGEQLVVKKIFIRGSSRIRTRMLASLENEMNLLGTLRHPHIVQYFGVQERPECVNIFMELMAGGSLKDQVLHFAWLCRRSRQFRLLNTER